MRARNIRPLLASFAGGFFGFALLVTLQGAGIVPVGGGGLTAAQLQVLTELSINADGEVESAAGFSVPAGENLRIADAYLVFNSSNDRLLADSATAQLQSQNNGVATGRYWDIDGDTISLGVVYNYGGYRGAGNVEAPFSFGLRLSTQALDGTPITGQLLADSGDSNRLKYWDGSTWQNLY